MAGLSNRQDVFEPKQRYALDLLAGGGEFGGAVAADAGLEGSEDLVLASALDGNDEREAEFSRSRWSNDGARLSHPAEAESPAQADGMQQYDARVADSYGRRR